jgi:TolA-binding protein
MHKRIVSGLGRERCKPSAKDVPARDVARAPSPATAGTSSTADRLVTLEEEVSRLRQELSEVQQQLATFRKQFE